MVHGTPSRFQQWTTTVCSKVSCRQLYFTFYKNRYVQEWTCIYLSSESSESANNGLLSCPCIQIQKWTTYILSSWISKTVKVQKHHVKYKYKWIKWPPQLAVGYILNAHEVGQYKNRKQFNILCSWNSQALNFKRKHHVQYKYVQKYIFHTRHVLHYNSYSYLLQSSADTALSLLRNNISETGPWWPHVNHHTASIRALCTTMTAIGSNQ